MEKFLCLQKIIMGYKNLLKLSSKSYLNLKDDDIKPNISFDILKKYSDGIIFLLVEVEVFFRFICKE